jgi:hypothetical protein
MQSDNTLIVYINIREAAGSHLAMPIETPLERLLDRTSKLVLPPSQPVNLADSISGLTTAPVEFTRAAALQNFSFDDLVFAHILASAAPSP